MLKRISRETLFGPLVLAGLIALAMLFAGSIMLARIVDVRSIKREQTVILNGMIGKRQEIAKSMAAQLVWDEAVRHLDNHFDPAWAQDNIGKFLFDTQRITRALVLDGDNETMFAAKDGVAVPKHGLEAIQVAGAKAIATVRREEAARGASRHAGSRLSDPIQADTITLVDDEPYIVTATLVQPDFGKARIKNARAPLVVTGIMIDDDFLADFAKRYMLDALHLHPGDSRFEQNEAHTLLVDDKGKHIATMDWLPRRPGSMLLHDLTWPALAFVSIFVGIVLILYRRSWRAAQNLIASEARASHLAYHDPLTGLPNRVMFFDRLGIALDQARRGNRAVAVHCIDLDRFKEINDTFGHQIGDELIIEAARRMAAICRKGDTFARLSGDEFAIVQTEATPARSARLARRIVEAMAAPFDLSSGRIFSGCSIGTTLAVENVQDPIEAVRHADLALYRAKHNGRGQSCFFEPDMDAAVRVRREIETDLRTALADGQLRMVYQPQSNRHGVITGVEALIRWDHPERGSISPAFFVPIAEECGLIAELGMFTLRRAFEDSHRWPKLKVAINISASQLRLKNFLPQLQQLIDEVGIDPKGFELEITEGLLLGDDPVTHDTLARLRQMGFTIALDDFGTGYSSLSYLQRYPIDKIKIDRSFITNLGVEDEAEAVVLAIVKLARALKLEVIAEGVETKAQRRHLLAMGCGETQGYLLSKPVTADQIVDLKFGRLAA